MAERTFKTAPRRARGAGALVAPALRRHAVRPGQQYVTHHFGTRLLQPALRVGAANDPLEREAETTAERIISMPVPQMAAPDASADGNGLAADGAMRAAEEQPSTDALETDPPIPEDHIDPDVPPAEDVDAEALTAADLNELETGVPVDTGGDPPLPETPAPTGEDVALPARGEAAVVGAEGGPAPAGVARRVAKPGSGRPLPDSVRAFMEPRFGRDFSTVRVHDHAEDRDAASQIGARAFTHRDHIWMGPGESVSDRKLMAHELTHVVQQTAPGPAKLTARAVENGEPPVRRGYTLNKAEEYARNIPGYRLISVIIGQSPITGDTVDFNAVNLLGGMMALVPGGNLLFERLEETRALEETFEWISSRLSDLNITLTRVESLVSDLIAALPDWPSDAIATAERLFKPLIDDILTFIADVTSKILEFIIRGALKLAGPWADKVWEIIQSAGAVLTTILEDPLAFAKNLFSAVLKGFNQFGSNILQHIKKGLLGWLFGAIQGLDIQIPERLDFKGLISIGLQIVGLTYASFRKTMVKKFGAHGERKMGFIEKSVEAVKILVKEGFVGMWQRVFQMIDGFRETVLGGIRDFVMKSLIMGGLSWLAGLSNPVGAVVKIVLSIYNMIVTFLERLDQILEVARSIFASIGAIAAGRIQEAADFIEKTIAATIPVVISFLAALVPITGIASSIRNIIIKLRTAVNRAIDKLVTFVTKKAQKLFSKLIAKINSKRKLPSANFKIGNTPHRIFAEKAGKKVDVFVESDKQTSDQALAGMQQQIPEFKAKASPQTLAEIMDFVNTFQTEETDAEKKADKIDPSSQKTPALKTIEDLKKELAQGSERLTKFGLLLADNGDVLTTDPTLLIRFQRSSYALEGKAGTYGELAKAMEGQQQDGMNASTLYERDHVPGLEPLRIISDLSKTLNAGQGGAPAPVRTGPEASGAGQDGGQAQAAPLGAFHNRSVNKPGTTFKAIVVDKKFNVRGAAAQENKEFEEAVTKPTPQERQSAAEAALARHVETRASQIAAEYVKIDDKDTRERAETGLADIRKAAMDDFGLSATIQTQQPKIEKPNEGEARSRSVPFLDPADPSERNFAEGEGRSGNYKVTTNKYVNEFLQFDHVLDSSFVEAVKGWKANTLWDPVLPAIKAAVTSDDAKKRKKNLSQRTIFGGSALASYSHNTSLAVGIFSRVNDRVASEAKTFQQPEAGLRLKQGIADAALEPMVTYVETGQGAPADAVAEAKKATKAGLDKRFEEHKAVIEAGYAQEQLEVAKANAEPPARKKAAEAQMNVILARMRLSLQSMRTEKDNLFT